MATTEDRPELETGVGEWKKELYEAVPERQGELSRPSPDSRTSRLHAATESGVRARPRRPGRVPVHARRPPAEYRGKLWTMRQFAGFGSAEETNARFKYLLDQGQTGLSIAFDMPTLMGYDTDHPRRGRVRARGRGDLLAGRHGDSARGHAARPGHHLDDDQLAGRDLCGDVSAWPSSRASRAQQLRGTTQNDILKEYIAQNEYIFPPEPSMRLVVDTFEFGAARDAAVEPDLDQRLPHPRGRQHRRAGAGLHAGRRHRLRPGGGRARARCRRFAPRLSFFFNAHNDFFEEIAKYRAARRIWARTCASVSAPRTRARAGCASTRRPPGCR